MRKKIFNFLPSTRMGIQAAVSIGIASILGHTLPIERPYWAILTAMLLISQTWSENIKRSLERIAMTIIGGMVGTFLYFVFKDYSLMLLFILLSSIFFAVYFIEVSYFITTFFATIFVVFLFADIQDWNTHLLVIRIYETFIGAMIAIITSLLVLPIRAQNNFQTRLAIFFRSLTKSMLCNSEFIYAKQHDFIHFKELQSSIFTNFIALQTSSRIINIENFFKLYPKKQFEAIMINLGLLMHYVTSSMQIAMLVPAIKQKPLIEDEIKTITKILSNNLKYLAKILAGKKPADDLQEIESIRLAIRAKLSEEYLRLGEEKLNWVEIHSFLYFLSRVNEIIFELKKITGKK